MSATETSTPIPIFLDADSEAALAAALPALLSRSYARYSNFTVAAAVIDADGRAHLGVNVENAAYPSGTCAEQTAIGAMVTAGGRGIATPFGTVMAGNRHHPDSPCNSPGELHVHPIIQRA